MKMQFSVQEITNENSLILPEGREMFTYKGKQEINHGGISVEEMVVPYIKLKN